LNPITKITQEIQISKDDILTANRKIAGRDLPVTLVKVDEQYMLFPP
jgi:hypothetical protein